MDARSRAVEPKDVAAAAAATDERRDARGGIGDAAAALTRTVFTPRSLTQRHKNKTDACYPPLPIQKLPTSRGYKRLATRRLRARAPVRKRIVGKVRERARACVCVTLAATVGVDCRCLAVDSLGPRRCGVIVDAPSKFDTKQANAAADCRASLGAIGTHTLAALEAAKTAPSQPKTATVDEHCERAKVENAD